VIGWAQVPESNITVALSRPEAQLIVRLLRATSVVLGNFLCETPSCKAVAELIQKLEAKLSTRTSQTLSSPRQSTLSKLNS
jgi:hypothetical protein